MSVQFIDIGGKEMALLPAEEFRHLLADSEEADDVRTAEAAERRRIEGEEYLPLEMMDRILAGEAPLKIWRQHRRYTLHLLSQETGIGSAYLSQLEGGTREGKPRIWRKIADVLNVTIDDILPCDPA